LKVKTDSRCLQSSDTVEKEIEQVSERTTEEETSERVGDWKSGIAERGRGQCSDRLWSVCRGPKSVILYTSEREVDNPFFPFLCIFFFGFFFFFFLFSLIDSATHLIQRGRQTHDPGLK
jgi:hypothetical protein